MTMPVVAGDSCHFVGDSITFYEWFAPSFVPLINATWPTPAVAPNPGINAGRNSSTTGASGVVNNSQPTKKQIIVTFSGVGGNTAADIAADVPSRILAYNPTKVILEVGINDAITGVNPATFAANYLSIITQTRAAIPGIPFLCIGCLCYGEQWLAGPAWGANIDDAAILSIDNEIISVCGSIPDATYVDLRNPLIAYEGANNLPGPPGAVSGIITFDGIHPIITAGQVTMGEWAFPYVSVAP
jgi:lysophospholipase L1-like esterase